MILALLFAILLGPERHFARHVAVEYVATNDGYVAFWSDSGTAYGTRIALDGRFGATKTLFRDRFIVGAAFDGQSIVVVTQQSLFPELSPIEVFRVAADLGSVSEPVALGSGVYAHIAADRGEYVVGWQINRTPDVFGQTLILTRLSASLSVIRQRTIELEPQPHVGGYVLVPSSVGMLVVWEDVIECDATSLCGYNARLRAARLTDDLTIDDPGGIWITVPFGYLGNAWWDGRDWVVVWGDNRRVYRSRVAPSGTLTDPEIILQTPARYYYNVKAVPLGEQIVVGAQFLSVNEGTGFVIARGNDVATLQSPFLALLSVDAGADGRVLLGYFDSLFLPAYRIVDVNAASGRARPARP